MAFLKKIEIIEMFAPIILFVYNRPWHTKQTVESLKKNELASNSDLYIYADGPKEDATEEQKNNINSVRDYIHTVSGFKSVTLYESPKNKGLDTSIICGVSQVLNKHKRCIVIEDDIITHPFFLRYINTALDLYENDPNIHMIGGFSYKIRKPFWYHKDVMLVPRCCSWGWGIWIDRWTDVDWEMADYDRFINNPKAISHFCRGGNNMLTILREQRKEKIPAWDITWDYTRNKKNGYVLIPIRSLTYNVGLDGSGIHCGYDNIDSRVDQYPLKKKYDIRLPRSIKPKKIIVKRYKESQDQDTSFFRKILWSLNKRKKQLQNNCFFIRKK